LLLNRALPVSVIFTRLFEWNKTDLGSATGPPTKKGYLLRKKIVSPVEASSQDLTFIVKGNLGS